MIIKGSPGGKGGHAGALANHLMRDDENTRVEIIERDPAAPGDDLRAILSEYQMLARTCSQGERGFYQASINPQSDDRQLTTDDWKQAADILEKRLGFEGQPRAIVLHEKDGREHIHVIWQRYDVETHKLRDYKQNYQAHMEAAREIEQALDLHRFKGVVHDGSYDSPDTQQSARSGITVAERKELITEIWRGSDSGRAFVAGLGDAGYDIARGDKQNTFVIVDAQGEAHSLVRQIKGVRKAELHARMAPFTPAHFKSVSELRTEQPREQPEAARGSRLEIEEQFAQERLALEARHARQERNLLRKQVAETKATLQNRPLRANPSQRQNLYWLRQDQRRASRHRIERERLLRRQDNQQAQLNRAERQALHEHDRRHRDHDSPVHALSMEDRQLAAVRDALQQLEQDDASPNSDIGWHNRGIAKLERHKQGQEQRIASFRQHQEAAKRLFRATYGKEAADSAYDNYRAFARDKTLRQANDELWRRPERFGNVQNEPSAHEIDHFSVELRSIHYTEKKVFTARLEVENGIDTDIAMQQHGIEGESWRYNPALYNVDRRIDGHRRAIGKAEQNPDDRRLTLMENLRDAATSLDTRTFNRLREEEREKVRKSADKLKEEAIKERIAAQKRVQARRREPPPHEQPPRGRLHQ